MPASINHRPHARQTDLRAMARMFHTGVPLADISYIFSVSPRDAYLLIWTYARGHVSTDPVSHASPGRTHG